MEARQCVVERGGFHNGFVIGAGNAAGAGEACLVVDRNPFIKPVGCVQPGEDGRCASHHALCEPPPSGGPIEVKDVRQFVAHREVNPVVEKTQRRRINCGARIHNDAIAREHIGRAVGDVVVVGEHEVHWPARFNEFGGESRVGAFGRAGGTVRHRVEPVGEVHAEVRGGNRAPRLTGIELRGGGVRRQQRAEQSREGDAPLHRSAPNVAKYSRSPSAMPRA